MNVIMLSGGSGKRLWPLSNDVRSKQFIKFLKRADGTYESMIERVFRQIRTLDDAEILVTTSKSQISEIKNQLGDSVGVCAEPARKDTFPAIALAVAFLKDVKGKDENDTVIISPIDHYVEDEYFSCFKRVEETVNGGVNVALIGIKPAFPSEKYGYILPEGNEEICKVKEFKEKPSAELAEKYIQNGGLWNGGVFGVKIGYVLKKAEEIFGFSSYEKLFSAYENLPKKSFDYAVLEHEKDIKVVRYAGEWKDVGTWNTFSETMQDKSIGKATFDCGCENVHVINELSVPVLTMGIKDVVVVASAQGILVADKCASSYIKPYVEEIDEKIMFAEKSWGSYRIINVEDGSLTILITLNAGKSMYYHEHARRDETWVVIEGEGKVKIDDKESTVTVGDVIKIAVGQKHKVSAITRLKLVEVQIGKDIDVSDKIKYSE